MVINRTKMFRKLDTIKKKIDEPSEIIELRKKADIITKSIKQKDPKLFKRISLKVLWEHDPIIWSDCPHHDTLKDAAEECEYDKKFNKGVKKG